MKIIKTLLIMIIAVLFALGTARAVYAWDGYTYVFDETGTLTERQINNLNIKAAALAEKRGCAAYIRIVGLVPDEYAVSIDYLEYYTDMFYFGNDLGYGDDRNGVVLLMEVWDVPGERDYLFYTYGPCTDVFNNSRRERMLDEKIVPLFAEAFNTGDFYAVADTFLDRVEYEFAFNFAFMLAIKITAVILIPAAVAQIVCMYWKRKMKNAVIARTADSYIPADGFVLTAREDEFLYRTTTRRKIERNSSSGGSGSSSSGRSSGGKV